jgi:hypothetical protein
MTESYITGNSGMPLTEATIEAMDDLTEALCMANWNIVETVALALGEPERCGVQITMQFMRPAEIPLVGFKPKGKKNVKPRSHT